MKNIALGIGISLSIVACSQAMAGKNPKEIRSQIEQRAESFALKRANPTTSTHLWKQAFVAYAVHELSQGTAPLEEILNLGQRVETNIPFTTYNDQSLRSYFKRAMENWDEQAQSIENDWSSICATLNSADQNQ